MIQRPDDSTTISFARGVCGRMSCAPRCASCFTWNEDARPVRTSVCPRTMTASPRTRRPVQVRTQALTESSTVVVAGVGFIVISREVVLSVWAGWPPRCRKSGRKSSASPTVVVPSNNRANSVLTEKVGGIVGRPGAKMLRLDRLPGYHRRIRVEDGKHPLPHLRPFLNCS